MIDDPDEPLVRQVAAGDGQALRQLMSRHLPRILALARRMLGDRALADDVVQETFLRVWRTAGDWRPATGRFSTWMHRVALNLCYDALRRRRVVMLPDPPEIADAAPLPDADAPDADARAVEAALQQIAPRQREAIILVYYQELPQAEAAAAMDVSVDALESLLARGRRSLQSILLKERNHD